MLSGRPFALQSAGSRVYQFTWWLAAASLRLFYRRIDTVDLHHFPAGGPVLLVANHPNYMVDPLAIATRTVRPIHFVAKGPLLHRYPLLSRFLRSLGMIPVYRRQDDPTRMHDNQNAFAHCADALEADGVICIFGEGESHAEPQVRNLYSGAARILLEAETRRPGGVGVCVVPVGLYFPSEDQYFSDGLVLFGRPIDTRPFLDPRITPPTEAARALTDEIERSLRELTLHVPDLDWVEFVEQLRALALDRLASRRRRPLTAVEHLRLSQEIVEVTERFRRRDLEAAKRFRRSVAVAAAHREAWRRHALPPADAAARGRSWLRRFADAVALPLALVGFAFNAVPYLVPRIWCALFVGGREKRAFVKFLVGMPSFAFWYGWLSWRLARRSRRAAPALWLLGPTAGLVGLRLRVHRRRWLDAWRHLRPEGAVRTGEELRAQEDALLERFDAERAMVSAQSVAGPDLPERSTLEP